MLDSRFWKRMLSLTSAPHDTINFFQTKHRRIASQNHTSNHRSKIEITEKNITYYRYFCTCMYGVCFTFVPSVVCSFVALVLLMAPWCAHAFVHGIDLILRHRAEDNIPLPLYPVPSRSTFFLKRAISAFDVGDMGRYWIKTKFWRATASLADPARPLWTSTCHRH